MDRFRFDELTRLLAAKGSRRAAFAALLGAALTGPAADALAKGKGKGKARKHNSRSRRKDKTKDRRQDKRKIAAQQSSCWPGVRCIPKKGGNVSKCDFAGSSEFEDFDCTRCNLSYTNLRNADASGANFTRANLSYACLVDADFSGATIAGNTNISFAIFCRTTMPGGNVNNTGCNNPTACCPTCNLDEGEACGLPGDVCCGGALCVSGTCNCPSGQTNCSGVCRDLDTDDNHCGACGTPCPSGSSCEDGECVIVVTPASMQGWQFYNDQNDTTIASSFDAGPGDPPYGDGSAELLIGGSSEGKLLSARIYNSTPLADVAVLKYTTYVTSSGGSAPSLQLGIDLDPSDAMTGWQGRLVYVPSQTQTVALGTWHTWDALDDAAGTGTGSWFFSRSATFAGGACPQSNMCTFQEVLTAFPDIHIHPTGDDPGDGAGIGFIGFKVGSGEGAVNANVDSLAIKLTGANEPTVVYNFEATP